MPTKVFGSTSENSDSKSDTSLFVQKSYLRTIYFASKIEEDIDWKNQYRIKKTKKQQKDPIRNREPASRNYVDNLFYDTSKIKKHCSC